MNRYQRLSLAVLAALAIALILTIVRADPRSMVLVGDYPGFHILGEMLRRYPASELYSSELQHSVENLLWPSFNGSYYQSVYPPYVAPLMLPFAYLGADLGRLIFGIGAIASFIAALRIGFPAGQRLVAAAALAVLWPVLQGTLGGQLSPFLMLLVALNYRALKNRNFKESGMYHALLLVKPQTAVLPLLGIAKRKQKFELLNFMFVAALWFIAGVLVLGIRWPLAWLNAVMEFAHANSISNAHLQTCLLVLPSCDLLKFIAIGCCAVVALALWMRRNIADELFFLLLLCAAPVVIPQTLFYDLSIAYFALAILWSRALETPGMTQTLKVFIPGFAIANILVIDGKLQLTPLLMGSLALITFIAAELLIQRIVKR